MTRRSKRPGRRSAGIEHVGAVGGGDEDDAVVGFEAVHFDEQLVEGLLALVVSAAETGTAMTADRVDFVDKDDAGSVLLALLEQVADAAGADADEHFNEVRTGDGEEGDVGFARDRACEQGLAGSRRPDEQHALGDAAAEALELLGLAQELDDFLELFLGFVYARDILEGNLFLLHGEQAGARLAEAHGLVSAGLHLAHHKQEQAEQDDHGQDADDGLQPEGLALILVRDGDAVLAHGLVKFRVVGRGEGGGDDGVEDLLALVFVVRGNLSVGHGDVGDFAGIDVVLELRGADGFIAAADLRPEDIVGEDEEAAEKGDPEKNLFYRRVQANFLMYGANVRGEMPPNFRRLRGAKVKAPQEGQVTRFYSHEGRFRGSKMHFGLG